MLMMLKTKAQGFLRDDQGNATIEAVIWLPLVMFILAATFSFHDAFRYKALNTKAAFTISDALSRETEAIDDAYLDGMVDLLEYLTRSEGPYSMRLTLVRFDGDEGEYISEWSKVRGAFDSLSTADIVGIQASLPTMLHNERLIVVETKTDYATPLDMEWFDTSEMFYNIAVTRPRFAPQLVWQDASS